MKSRFTAFCLVLSLSVCTQVSAQNEKPMTNQDVVRLVRLGLNADIVITKINESAASYDLSVEGLAMLGQSRVPNEVIKAMQAKAANPARLTNGATSGNHFSDGGGVGGSSASSGTDGPSPYPLPADKGAYLWDGAKLHLLYQSTVPSMGQNVWRSITPFVKKKFELQLVGPFAKVHYDNNQPTILASGLGEVIPGIPAYRLLYVKTGGMLKDRRIVGSYSVGGFFGSIEMVDNEIQCQVKKVADGVYAITPLKPLRDGEYGLVQVPKMAEMSSRPSFAPPVWDFGIYAEGHPGEAKRGKE